MMPDIEYRVSVSAGMALDGSAAKAWTFCTRTCICWATSAAVALDVTGWVMKTRMETLTEPARRRRVLLGAATPAGMSGKWVSHSSGIEAGASSPKSATYAASRWSVARRRTTVRVTRTSSRGTPSTLAKLDWRSDVREAWAAVSVAKDASTFMLTCMSK